jgi:ATP-dependent DNA helicase
MKVDVEMDLPPKKEYVLYCPLSMRQREAYDKVLDGGLRSWLIKGGTAGESAQKGEERKGEEETEEESEGDEKGTKRRVSKRQARTGRKSYAVDGDDDEYFDMVENGDVDERGVIVLKTNEEKEAEQTRIAEEHQVRTKGLCLAHSKFNILPALSFQFDRSII